MIEIGRNSIVIRNVDLDSSEFKRFKNKFSIYDTFTYKYTMSAFTIIDNDIYMPASVNISDVESCFPNLKCVKNTLTTAHSENIRITMKSQPRDELQHKSIRFLMSMVKDENHKSRFLSLATGSGKTYVTINFISCIKKRAMIIVDTIDLAEQWKREVMKHSDLKECDVTILSGSEALDRELKLSNKKVYIAIHRTLANLIGGSYNGVNQLMNKLKIGIRVFDEAHVTFRNICQINSLSNVEYTVYLSATPNRSNFTDNKLYSSVFRDIPYFNGKQMQDGPYHTVLLCGFNSSPSLEATYSVRTQRGFSIPLWGRYIENEGFEPFIMLIQNMFEKFKFIENNNKVAIMVPTNNLIDKVKEALESTIDGLEVGVFTGDIKKSDRENQLSKQVFLTNDKMFEKGIDVKDLAVLINCVPFSSSVKTEQTIGRLRYRDGKPTIMIDVYDKGFNECLSTHKARKRFYKKKAKNIIEID